MSVRHEEKAHTILLLSPLIALAIGVTDYFTGPFLSFSPIYLVPIILAAWFGSLSSGLILCVFSVSILFVCDALTLPTQLAPGILIWNSVVRFLLFGSMVYLVVQRKKSESSLIEHQSRIRKLLDALPVGVFVLDNLGKASILNRMAIDILGKDKPPDDVSELPGFYQAYVAGTGELYAPENLPLIKALRGERITVQDMEIRRSDRSIPLSVTAAPIRDDSGNMIYAVAAFSDITEQKRAEQQIREANQQLHAGIQALEERNREITILSEMQEALHSSLTTDEALDRISQFLPLLFPDSAGALYVMQESGNILETRKLLNDESIVSTFESSQCNSIRRGRTYSYARNQWGALCSHAMKNALSTICAPMISHGDVVALLHLYTGSNGSKAYSDSQIAIAGAVAETLSVTFSNVQLRDKLHSMAVRDPLTDLFNRRYMSETLAREISRATRNDSSMAMIVIDIDHFKKYNDTHGHPAGDRLLKEFAGVLQASARKEDLACRFGGEEFILLLSDSSPEAAYAKAENIRLEAEQLHEGRPGIFPVTASFGIAFFPTHGSGGEEIIKAADAALYEAKASGRNCIRMAL